MARRASFSASALRLSYWRCPAPGRFDLGPPILQYSRVGQRIACWRIVPSSLAISRRWTRSLRGPLRVWFHLARRVVRCDVRVLQPELALIEAHEGLPDLTWHEADSTDLGPLSTQSGFQAVFQK